MKGAWRWILALAALIAVVKFVKPSAEPQTESVRQVDVVTLEERQDKKRQELMDNALSYAQASEVSEAKKNWKELVQKFPQSPDAERAYYELFRLAVADGKVEEANRYYKELVQYFPASTYKPQAMFEYANTLLKLGELEPAKALYKEIMSNHIDFEKLSEVVSKLEAVNMDLLFSRKVNEFKEIYEVQRGDSLYAIAKRFNTTIDFLEKANGLSKTKVIHPGDRLIVLKPETKISVNVDKSQRSLMLLLNGEVIRRYNIAIGADNDTPTGRFTVQNKLKDPVWFNAGSAIAPDDPRNVLGTRWLGFDRDLGIHGTREDKNILDQTSNGCVRMYNPEVEELYTIVRVGDPVIIVE